ncbi:copper resistance CopC family protein [Candidatus Leptofilum sp.]|uniref:copper resistance CopC family protein n=1 Tax=Candidatus Leptofilum sp. TaxID=3241576 RepID=UPI003B5B9910
MRKFWLILWGAAVFVFIPTVFAHAELVSAMPEPGSTIAELTELRLTFSEPIGLNGQIQLHQNFISAADLQPVVENESELVTAVPPLPDGVYTVQWSVISADGHPIRGSYSLGIDGRPGHANPTPWFFGGILLILGMGTAVWLHRKQST